MPNTIYNTMQKASSGLAASQAGITVTGHNISNVNTDGYSRQRIDQENIALKNYSPDYMSLGVTTASAKRVYDDIIAKNLRSETSDLEYYKSTDESLKGIEVYFNELEEGAGLGGALKDYFNAWADLANTAPDNSAEAMSKRQVVIDRASVLSSKLNDTSTSLNIARDDSNKKIKMYVEEINNLAAEISSINKDIAAFEGSGKVANDLRDRRDLLLDKMSNLVDINVYENTSGITSVFIGNNALIDGATLNRIMLYENKNNNGYYDIYWGTNRDGASVKITEYIKSGKIAAELDMRDHTLKEYSDDLDGFTKNLIQETNNIHAKGYGDAYFTTLTSSNAVLSKDLKLAHDETLNDLGIKSGTLQISIFDKDGNFVQDLYVNIDPEKDSLNDIVEKISKTDDPMIRAAITDKNELYISAKDGFTFAFKDDTSNFLSSIGLNNFFTGANAENISVANNLKTTPTYLAVHNFLASGDNSNAKELSELRFKQIDRLGNQTLSSFYTTLTGKIGSNKAKIGSLQQSKEYSVNQLKLKLDEVKGVSLDEEFVNMIKFQKAYEANARMVTTVDEMLSTIINNMGIVGR